MKADQGCRNRLCWAQYQRGRLNIIRRLKEDGRIFKHATRTAQLSLLLAFWHAAYLQNRTRSFVRVKSCEIVVANNKQIHWVPEAIGRNVSADGC